MIVFTRKVAEVIMIGDDIIVTVVEIRGDKVRIGIEAPKDIPVCRKEVYEAIRRDAEQRLQQQEEEPPPKRRGFLRKIFGR